MIKNVVFDVGMVLADFRWFDYMLDLGISPEHADFLGKNMVLTKYWDEMDLGIFDEEKGCEFFSGLFPEYRDDIEKFWKDPAEIVWEYDYAEGLIRDIKAAGYNVYLLSNYPPKMSAIHWPHFKFRKHTDGEVISGIEKVAKPDPAIFKLLCDRYFLNPSECLFIDDREKNVNAAMKLGMKGFVWEPKGSRPEDASLCPGIEKLKKMLAIE